MSFLTVERQLIEFIKTATKNTYIGDDCAVLPGGLLASSDTLVEGTHFLLLQTISLEDLGWKSIAVNLSDIAAMAGTPQYLLINFILPADFPIPEFKQLFLSMVNCAASYQTQIIGGDIVSGHKLTISISILGKANPKGNWSRSGARVGDIVFVTGDFGASAAGLWALLNHRPGFEYCKEKHARPKARILEASFLALNTSQAGALMDTSDGLADALVQISSLSKVGIEIDEQLLPVDKQTLEAASQASVEPLDWVLYGGEDYELVGCASTSDWQLLESSTPSFFKKIGVVTNSSEVLMKRWNGDVVLLDLAKSFQHFAT